MAKEKKAFTSPDPIDEEQFRFKTGQATHNKLQVLQNQRAMSIEGNLQNNIRAITP